MWGIDGVEKAAVIQRVLPWIHLFMVRKHRVRVLLIEILG